MFESLDIKAIVDDFIAKSDTIPFGNSDYQEITFVVAPGQTPERMYRAAIMQMSSRLEALTQAYFNLQREDLEIEELEHELSSGGTDFRARRLQIDLAEKRLKRLNLKKLVDDAVRTYNLLNEIVSHIPKPTREQFELAEPTHFKAKLERSRDLITQFGSASGPIEALLNMETDVAMLISAIPEIKSLAENFTKTPDLLTDA